MHIPDDAVCNATEAFINRWTFHAPPVGVLA